ncbi:hypothetical protein [Salinicoccus roseus]|uniref:Uncharacterized protein n=1 Tax=Salinicoccus roseus TaxID=45670 RepID=A0A265E9U5_9STAP|nr:hypothetical protein [Salinicoccus roseus]OZT78255.1 hypothetical protein CFN03_02960 [Salinicoccus roseus]
MYIYYKKYSSVRNYKDNRYMINNSQKSNNKDYSDFYNLNKFTIIRSAIIVGMLPNSHQNISREVKLWRIKSVITFIEFNKQHVYPSENLDFLEQSEKTIIGYFLGMVFAHIHMQKCYGLRHIAHLKTHGIITKNNIYYNETNQLVESRRSPDFWGYNKKNKESYLIEAKGSTQKDKRITPNTIERAALQLNDVMEVRFTGNQYSNTYNISFTEKNKNLNKLIIGTHPFSKQGEYIQEQVVTQSNRIPISLQIDENIMIYHYYCHLIRLLQSEKNDIKSFILEEINLEFKVLYLRELNCYIGVMKEIYEVLDPLVNEEFNINCLKINISKEISKTLDTLEFMEIEKKVDSQKNISLGIDGVICFEKKA